MTFWGGFETGISFQIAKKKGSGMAWGHFFGDNFLTPPAKKSAYGAPAPEGTPRGRLGAFYRGPDRGPETVFLHAFPS